MEKYNYIMKYVPARKDLAELVFSDRAKISPEEINDDASTEILVNAALSAIESMMSMCALVYMKCMENLD